MQETWVQSLGWEDHLRRKRQPTPVFLPGKPHGQRSLAGCSSWGHKELDTTEHAHTHACETGRENAGDTVGGRERAGYGYHPGNDTASLPRRDQEKVPGTRPGERGPQCPQGRTERG